MEDEADRHEGDTTIPARRGFSLEQHPSRTSTQRHQRRVGLAHTLRKDQHRLARPEMSGRGRKHCPVPRGVAAPFLAAVDRQRAQQTQEGADERVTEQRRFRDWHQPSRDQPEQEHRVNQRVLVVGRHDQRPGFRNVLEADEVDAPVIEAKHPSSQGPHQAVADRHPSGYSLRRAARVQRGLTHHDVDAPGH